MADTERQLAPPPGWGTPFPPEKPRVDVDQGMPDGMPTAAAVAAASATGDELPGDFHREDRRPLDRRRRRARTIDTLVLAVPAVLAVFLFGGATIAVGVLILAIDLSYFFVMETLKGQTIGKKVMKLRVVRIDDGRAAPASKIAARTIARPLDYSLAGILVVLASKGKRQRIGDIFAGTCVRNDDRPFTPAPESPLLVVYPLLWIGAAVGTMVAFPALDPMLAQRSAHPYMAKIDKICEKRVRQEKALDSTGGLNLVSGRLLLRQEARKIDKLPPPPPDVRGQVQEVVDHHRNVNRALDRMMKDVHRTPGDPNMVVQQHEDAILGIAGQANERYRELGLPYCAA